MKIALVHDDFVQAGGAESLFETFASIWPSALVYTALVNWNKLPLSIGQNRVITSWMQKIPFAPKFYKALLPFYPLAFESFNFDDFDVVISSTTRFAKSIITKPKTIHICYLNSLPRFLWDDQALKDYLPSVLRILLGPVFAWLKRWDRVASSRVDYYIANSQNVATNLKAIYKRDSAVIYPFADTDFFKPAKIHNWKLKNQNYYLMVSRLVRWKKIDLAIKGCAALGLNLIIIGDGPDKKRLERLSKEVNANVKFLGRVRREELRTLYRNCQALIVTQEEDFGIAAVEAQACGRPVIAYQKGGLGEIVTDHQTGLFFKIQSQGTLQDAIHAQAELKWSVSKSRQNSLRFSRGVFVKELKNKVNLYARGA